MRLIYLRKVVMHVPLKKFFALIVALVVSGPAQPINADSASDLLEELRELREEVEERRVQLRGELQALKEVLGESSTLDGLPTTTVQMGLAELEALKGEVARHRTKLDRELQVLKEALGPAAAILPEVEGQIPAGAMTREELEAELRILREEWEMLKANGQSVKSELDPTAPSGISVRGQVRTRFEGIDTDFVSGAADLQHLLRSRVAVVATPHADTEVQIQFQDARQWGEELNTLTDGSADNFDVHQAFVQIDKIYSRPVSLKIGRQELIYGNERLIGAVGWHNTGRSFDAIRVRYGGESRVDIFNAKLREKGLRDRNFFGIYGHLKSAEQILWEPYVLFEHDKSGGAERTKRATAGLHANGSFASATGHRFGYRLEGAYQAGDLGTQTVAAWMATGALNYQSPHVLEHKLVIGLDVLSGDEDPASGDYKAFDTLFATNHKFYGHMDYFLNIPTDTRQAGLVDAVLKGEMKIAESTSLAVHVHNLTLLKGSEKALGQEVDAILSYDYNDGYRLQWGALVFVPGTAMKSLQGGDDVAIKSYIQTVANF